MPSVTVNWQRQSFPVDVDMEQLPLVFKMQLYSLTGVPPERQKIMVKGGMLKDDSDWSKVGLKDGQKLMMMGTAEKLPEAPTASTVFMEDLPEDEQDVSGLTQYGAGLANHGNTCYMNSTLQCLYRVPELRQELAAYGGGENNAAPQTKQLAIATKEIFKEMERSAQPVMPMGFLMQLRRNFPQFAQTAPQTGLFMQQDAEECWTQLLYALRESLTDSVGTAGVPPIQHLFGVGLRTRLRCEESGEEINEESSAFALKCNISIDVNNLSEGIRLGLRDDREKNSAALERLAAFTGTSAMTRLPLYLTVQMVRFFYKVDVQQKAKILRKVVFPLVLDVFEFCSPELQAELRGPRAAWQAAVDAASEAERTASAAKRAAENGDAAPDGKASAKKSTKAKASARAPAKSEAKMEATPEVKPEAAPADVDMADAGAPSGEAQPPAKDFAGHLTGKYELLAVLTHKGRSADSGHYVTWAKQDDATWVQFDDEDMILRKEEEIVGLSGGGDWHMAYLLLYRALRVAGKPPEAKAGEAAVLTTAAAEAAPPGPAPPAGPPLA